MPEQIILQICHWCMQERSHCFQLCVWCSFRMKLVEEQFQEPSQMGLNSYQKSGIVLQWHYVSLSWQSRTCHYVVPTRAITTLPRALILQLLLVKEGPHTHARCHQGQGVRLSAIRSAIVSLYQLPLYVEHPKIWVAHELPLRASTVRKHMDRKD